MKKVTQNKLMKALDWAYDKAVGDIPIVGSAYDLGNNFLEIEGTLEQKVDSLIRWQCAKAGTSGFVTGFGGFMTMPITIPANLASIFYIQIRMIAAIAHMGGFDLRDDRVRTLVYVCMTGKVASDILKDVGIQIGKQIALNSIKKISGTLIKRINQVVGFKLFTKFGEKGIINLSKTIPFVGGVVGGAFDITTTNTIGKIAKQTFIKQ